MLNLSAYFMRSKLFFRNIEKANYFKDFHEKVRITLTNLLI